MGGVELLNTQKVFDYKHKKTLISSKNETALCSFIHISTHFTALCKVSSIVE
jgi:hypothetical protein